ncbi:hypothetical protein [Polaribacter marinivivus]|uniref:Uncharacterized protein n=1 Tax=Polaribacter marinivivus TaxID=1524260 RepID=A0ABV8RCI1_9FLAO
MEDEEVVIEIIKCEKSDISVTKEDNIIFNDPTDPVLWEGSFTNDQVKLSYTVVVGQYNESETYNFIFNKVNECLKIDRAYKYYDGKLVDVSAVTEMQVSEFYIKDWEINSLFSGLLVYVDPHDKNTYSRKFWIDSFKDASNLVEIPKYFDDCFKDKFPIEIDVDKDGIIDFNLTYEENNDIGNTPKFDSYTIQLIPASNKNKILSPKKNSSPYTIIFEPPFSSENTRQYFGGVKNTLDIFYEFESPYENYNYFLSNNLTYKNILQNDLPDYFVISKDIGGIEYFGWIKFILDTSTCQAEVLFAYLETNPNTHVKVN